VLNTKFNERKKVARKNSENDGHRKVMVDGKGLSLKDLRKEQGGECWSKRSTGQRTMALFSS
jgi:hypothetical protein